MDAKTYQLTILQPALARNELPDELSRYGLSPDAGRIDAKEIDNAIKVTRRIWGELTNSAKYGEIVRSLLAQAGSIEPKLRDATTRKRLGREVQSRRFKVLDDWIHVRCQEGGGAVTRDALSGLVERFAPRGISRAEIEQRLRELDVHVEKPAQKQTSRVPSWESPPDELRAVALQRETIRASLVSLGHNSIGGFLGLSDQPTREEIVTKRSAKEKDWAPKSNDARKAAATRLLTILKTQVKDEPDVYRLFLECEGERTLRPFVEDAALDKTISVPEQEQLARQAREQGLGGDWIRRLIRQVAQERGAIIEPPSSRAKATDSPSQAGAADPRPAPTSQPAPKARENVWTRWRRWEHRHYWPVLLVAAAFKFITGPSADRHPTPSGTEVALNAVAHNPSTREMPASPLAAPAAPSPTGNSEEVRPPSATTVPTVPSPPVVPPAVAPPPIATPAAPSSPPAVAPTAVAVDRGRAADANRRGSRLNDRGRFELAAAAFQEAVHADPTYAGAWANLSWAQYRAGRADEAEASASQAIRLAGSDTQAVTMALYTSGRVAEAAGEYDKARAAYSRILELDPSHKLARSAHGTLDLYLAPPARLLAAADKVLRGEILADDDVASMTDDELRIVRNAPYARHGKDFRDPGLNAFYYGPEARVVPRQTIDGGFKPADLTSNDKANIQFFKALRTSSDRAASVQEENGAGSDVPTTMLPPADQARPPAAHVNTPTPRASWRDPFAD